MSLDKVYQKLKATPKGLSSAEVEARLEQYGRNELVDKKVNNREPPFMEVRRMNKINEAKTSLNGWKIRREICLSLKEPFRYSF